MLCLSHLSGSRTNGDCLFCTVNWVSDYESMASYSFLSYDNNYFSNPHITDLVFSTSNKNTFLKYSKLVGNVRIYIDILTIYIDILTM